MSDDQDIPNWAVALILIVVIVIMVILILLYKRQRSHRHDQNSPGGGNMQLLSVSSSDNTSRQEPQPNDSNADHINNSGQSSNQNRTSASQELQRPLNDTDGGGQEAPGTCEMLRLNALHQNDDVQRSEELKDSPKTVQETISDFSLVAESSSNQDIADIDGRAGTPPPPPTQISLNTCTPQIPASDFNDMARRSNFEPLCGTALVELHQRILSLNPRGPLPQFTQVWPAAIHTPVLDINVVAENQHIADGDGSVAEPPQPSTTRTADTIESISYRPFTYVMVDAEIESFE